MYDTKILLFEQKTFLSYLLGGSVGRRLAGCHAKENTNFT